jgi:hypothetical protein
VTSREKEREKDQGDGYNRYNMTIQQEHVTDAIRRGNFHITDGRNLMNPSGVHT